MGSISDSGKGILFAAFTALLWGFLPIVLKVSLGNLSPVDVTWSRFVLAFILLALFHLIRRPAEFKIFIKPPPLLILASICLGLNYLGFISGVHYTTPAIAEIFIQSGAFLLAIAGFTFFKEKASIRQFLGIVVVFGGLAIFNHEQIVALAGNVGMYKKGVLWTLFGGVMWAIYMIFQKKLVREYEPMTLNLVVFALPAIGYIPFVNFNAFAVVTPGMWGILFFLGANTLMAYGALSYALKFLDANKISVVITMNPIITFSAIAILMAMEVAWVEHENFTLVSILGASLVILGGVMTVLRRRKV